ncbi:argininosuccinate lyase [uncultured Aliiroseovarius sp.]|uniref:argininosuccinate lyase n=1 Tax=uncultured Aliiroseovarius sp. TaxID=1658783 RepID=UPI002591A989|nr:argininosuccinate lyase [uncultured Aliiroseovarius sp.]
MTDLEHFPHPVYTETVLAPLFEGVKANYATHMADINAAHLAMLAETGILTAEDAGKIARALAEIADETDLSELVYTGEYEDYFFFVEAELKRRLGDDLGGMLHTARSRNDMDHTVFKMALRTRADTMLAELSALARIMLDKAKAEAETPIVAYTHGQPAQISTFGHYLSAALEVLLSDIARLVAARASFDLCPMGAAAITTSGFPIDRHRMADLLGFSAPRRNSYGCIASVDYVTGFYSALKLPFLHLGRLVQDFQFWTAFEVGQLWVPGSLVQISSIMPQKRNPVPIEHLRHLMSVTVGRCDTIVNVMHNTPFTDMNDSEGEVQQAGYAAFESGGRAARLLAVLIGAVSVQPDRVQAISDAACATITELADTLVRQDGLSFRQAHHVAALTSRGVIADGRGLSAGQEIFVQVFRDEIDRDSTLSPDAYQEAVSATAFIARRDRFGGPALPALQAAFGAYAATLADLETDIAKGPQRVAAADAARAQAFARLTET